MKKILLSITLVFITALGTTPTYAQEDKTVNTEMKPFADIYQWRYKIKNGKLYKRLWNASKNRWESDWILVK